MSFDQIKIQMQHIIDDMLAAGNQAGDVVENLVNTFSLDREFASEYLTRFLEQKETKTDNIVEQCENCRFFHPARIREQESPGKFRDIPAGYGVCRESAPVMIGGDPEGRWPRVYWDLHCGRWKK